MTFHHKRSQQLPLLFVTNIYLEVAVGVCDLVQIQECLVDSLLELESGLHGLKSGSPLVLSRLLDVVENDAPAALHLELHEFLGVFLLFVGSFLEVLGEARESYVVPVKVVRLCVEERKRKLTTRYYLYQ